MIHINDIVQFTQCPAFFRLVLLNNSGRAEKGKVREHTVRWYDGREWPPWSADYSATNILLIRRQAVRARSQNVAAWWAGPAAERWRASGRHWCVRSYWQPWVWFVLTRVTRCLSAWRSMLQVHFFFSFLFMNDTVECRRHSLLLRICSPSTLQTDQKRSVSPSAYISLYIYLYISLKWNVLFRETHCSEKNRHSVFMEEDVAAKQEKAGL